MRTRIVSIVCILLSLVISFFLIVGIKNYNNDISENRKKFASFEKSVAEHESKKKEAEKNIFRLNQQLDEVDKRATVSILVLGMDEDIYNLIFPIMKSQNIKGTLVITGDTLPGTMGLLNDAQIDELIKAGWSVIPGYSPDDGDNGITSSAKWISDYGYSSDNIVYADSDYLTDDIRNSLTEEGYTTIISGKTAGSVDDITVESITDVWNISSVGYNGNKPKGILNDSIQKIGNIIFSVSFEENEDIKFDENKLSSMLEYLKLFENEDYLYIGTVAQSRNFKITMDQKLYEIENTIKPDIEKNEAIISEANAALDKIYNSYID